MSANTPSPTVATLPHKLAEAFEVSEDIEERVRRCDFSRVNITDKASHEGTLICQITPSLSGLRREDVASMDLDLKIAIVGTTRVIRNLGEDAHDWDHVVSALQQCPVLDSREIGRITRADRLVKDGFNWFRLTGDQDDCIVREVRCWFFSLIQDEDIIRATPINIQTLTEAVAATGFAASNAVGDGPFSWNTPDSSYEKTVLDIAVLRYPDSQQHFFKVYRIRLEAWSYVTHILGMANNKNGITGQFNCHIYHPRSEIIDRLAIETKERLSQEAEDIFD